MKLGNATSALRIDPICSQAAVYRAKLLSAQNRRPAPDKESVDVYSRFSKGLGFKNSLDENLARAHHGTPFGKDIRQLKVLVKK